MVKQRLMLIIPFSLIVMLGWGTVGNEERAAAKLLKEQTALCEKAESYVDDKVFTRAIELYEQAASISVGDVNSIEKRLIELYLENNDTSRAISMLEKRVKNNTAESVEYIRLAEIYEEKNYENSALGTVNAGLEKYPDNEELTELHNKLAFIFKECIDKYKDTSYSCGGFIAANNGEAWGYCEIDGSYGGRFDYSYTSPYVRGYSVAVDNGSLCILDIDFQRYSLCKDKTMEKGYYDGTAIVAYGRNGYKLFDINFEETSEEYYEFIGRYSGGGRAVKTSGGWTMLGKNGTIINEEMIYSDIALNEHEEAYNCGRMFVSDGEGYYMVDGEGTRISENVYEAAYAFFDGGEYAAVKSNGKWGFVNTNDELVIPYSFDDAKSFSCGFAPVCKNGKWGIIGTNGCTAVEFDYSDIRPVVKNTAQIKHSDGNWHFIRFTNTSAD
ncbi:MAG: WG repeat-containing protein [Huintestinicola sp.]